MHLIEPLRLPQRLILAAARYPFSTNGQLVLHQKPLIPTPLIDDWMTTAPIAIFKYRTQNEEVLGALRTKVWGSQNL